MIAEAREWLDARASMESADQSLHIEEIEVVADAAKHERVPFPMMQTSL